MICIAVPVCRPLYNRFLDKFTSRGTGSYQRQNGSGQSPGFALHTFGGSTLLPRGMAGVQRIAGGKRRTSPSQGSGERPGLGEHKMGSTSTYAVAIGTRQEENQSDEEILGAVERNPERMGRSSANGIRVTDEIKVTTSTFPEGT